MRHLLFLLVLCCTLGFCTSVDAQEKPIIYPFSYQNQWGVVNQARETILPPSLDSIGLFIRLGDDALHASVAIAQQNDRMGLINPAGKWLLKPKVDSISKWQYHAPALRWVKRKGKFGLMDLSGKKAKWLIKPRFTEVGTFAGRKLALAPVSIGDLWGVVNNKGDVVVECTYHSATLLDDYSDYPDIKLMKDEVVSYVDAFGEPRDTEEMREREEDLMWDDVVFEDSSIEENRSHRVRTQQAVGGNQIVILEERLAAGPFETKEQRTITSDYRIVEIKVQERYSPLRLNAVVVQKDGLLGLWGSEGLIAPGAVYNRIDWQPSNRYDELGYTSRNGQTGLVSRDGTLLLPPAFSKIEEYGTLFRFVHPDGYRGYADTSGRVFLPQEVDLGL